MAKFSLYILVRWLVWKEANKSAAATVIMPSSTAGNNILDFVTTKHPKSGHMVQPAINDRQQQPRIMDYRVVECNFRKKGLTRALQNCPMIMGLVLGVCIVQHYS